MLIARVYTARLLMSRHEQSTSLTTLLCTLVCKSKAVQSSLACEACEACAARTCTWPQMTMHRSAMSLLNWIERPNWKRISKASTKLNIPWSHHLKCVHILNCTHFQWSYAWPGPYTAKCTMTSSHTAKMCIQIPCCFHNGSVHNGMKCCLLVCNVRQPWRSKKNASIFCNGTSRIENGS